MKTNPSRSTVSPTRTSTERVNTEPSQAKVENSPFSPQGSTVTGKSAKMVQSNARPASSREASLGSMQTSNARRPPASFPQARCHVLSPQKGKSRFESRAVHLGTHAWQEVDLNEAGPASHTLIQTLRLPPSMAVEEGEKRLRDGALRACRVPDEVELPLELHPFQAEGVELAGLFLGG